VRNKSKIAVTGAIPRTEPIIETVIVDGKTITVHEGSFVMALRKEGIRRKMIETLKSIEKDIPDGDEEETALVMFYPPMMACSSCDKGLFTPVEFLSLKEVEVDAWYQAVNKLNPHWFPSVALMEEELKKKEI